MNITDQLATLRDVGLCLESIPGTLNQISTYTSESHRIDSTMKMGETISILAQCILSTVRQLEEATK